MSNTRVPEKVTCANCGMVYQKGTKPPCPQPASDRAAWSNEMLAFMRCTAAK